MSAPLQISVAARVSEFLTTFQLDGDYVYRTALGNLAAEGGRSLIIDYEHLTRFDSNLAASLLLAPKDLLPEFQRGAYDALGSINAEYVSSVRQRDGLHIRFKGAMDQVPLREVRESVLNRLITVSGIILRASEIRLQPTDAVFTCSNGHDTHVLQEDPTRVRRPEKCEGCDEMRAFELDRVKTKYVDIQILKIQELPEELPPGEIPQAFDVLTSHDQINKVRPGDRVVLTGIPESIPEYNPSVGRGTFKIQINCNHVEIIGKGPEQMEISEEEVQKIKQIAALPDAYLRLIKSIAPSIIGLQVQKEAMLLLLVGSPMIKYPDETQVRGNINILLVGDPGIAKSQMLRFAAQVSPRGMYASGKMSTAAGLSAAVVKDKNNVMSLEAGVVVLADQGIASIDEFEHLRAEDRSALHEMMEQQTVTIAKGGFHATLNARTAIFAAANPILGIYDPYKDFLENVSLPPPLLTRFDLIYVMRDLVSPDDDLKLARHILDLRATGKFKEDPPVDLPLLKKYIAFSKRLSPKITAGARENFEEYYLRLRKRASENQIPATPRTLESLIRLATARARLLLRDDVLVEDAEAAMRLMEEMMNTVLVDTASKTRGDFGVLMGKSSSKISSLSRGLDVFKRLERESPSGSVKTEALLQELQKSLSISEDEAKRLLGTMEREGNIWSPSGGNYKRIG